MTSKINFKDSTCCSIAISSSWKSVNVDSQKTVETQTPASMYEFSEVETQTGISLRIFQDQITSKDEGSSLLDFYASSHRDSSRDIWRHTIEKGNVTVDCEVCYDPELKVHKDYFLEFVDSKRDVEVRKYFLFFFLSLRFFTSTWHLISCFFFLLIIST